MQTLFFFISSVHYDNTRSMPLAKTSTPLVKNAQINSFRFHIFSDHCKPQKKNLSRKEDDFDDDPRAALALRDALLERVWGFGRCARVLLTRRRAARCELFTRLFVLFVLLRALNGV